MHNIYSLIHHISRCGEDLITFFNTPAIQQFVNGIPARETLSVKQIYQPGTLRKVYTYTVSLLEFILSLLSIDFHST